MKSDRFIERPLTETQRAVRRGDREAVARVLIRDRARLERRIRLRVSARTRRLFNTLDIFSTLMHRLDQRLLSREMSFDTPAAVIAYAMRMADHIVIDRARTVRSIENAEKHDRRLAMALSKRIASMETPGDEEFLVMLRDMASSFNDEDRFLLWSWLSGRAHSETAELLGKPAAHIRWRWKRLRKTLEDRLREEGAP